MNTENIEEDIAALSLMPDDQFLKEILIIRKHKGDRLTTDSRWICFVKNELETRIAIHRLTGMVSP